MARDRKRAKQRRARRAQQPARVGAEQRGRQAPPAEPTAPGALDRASAEVELAEASIAHDAPESDVLVPEEDELELDEQAVEPEAAADVYDEGAERAPHRRVADERPARGGSRFGNFLRACWAELNRVQWPDRRQVTQATGVVLGFVLIAGAYLGLLDAVFSRLIDRIL